MGFGYVIPGENLAVVNAKCDWKDYSDETAAITINSTAEKPKLIATPFTWQFKYGCNHDTYWTYNHVVLQSEDCVDCFKVLHPDLDFIFLFNHQNSHNWMQPNGLSLNKISIRYGGKQPHMRQSSITDPNILGPFHNLSYEFQLGMVQSVRYSPLMLKAPVIITK